MPCLLASLCVVSRYVCVSVCVSLTWPCLHKQCHWFAWNLLTQCMRTTTSFSSTLHVDKFMLVHCITGNNYRCSNWLEYVVRLPVSLLLPGIIHNCIENSLRMLLWPVVSGHSWNRLRPSGTSSLKTQAKRSHPKSQVRHLKMWGPFPSFAHSIHLEHSTPQHPLPSAKPPVACAFFPTSPLDSTPCPPP